jgi:integrase
MGEKRRGAGEGSIYRRSDGRWVGQYEVEGKRRYVYGQDREGVRARLTKALADRDAGMVFDSRNLTVCEYVPLWLDSIESAVGPRTWKRHEELTRLHVIPRLGSAKLDKLNAMQVQSLYRKKLDSGLSPTTVRKIHATLYKALKQAVRWQLVPRNVCESVTPPRAAKVEIEALTKEQVKGLLDTARTDGLYALYVLACTTGMRQGEILALKWDCVDFEAGTVRVKRTVWKGKVYPPKTPHSRRTIGLSQTALRALWDHRQEQTASGEWCFPNRAGKPMDCHHFISRRWKGLVKAAGLQPNLRFHDLRHTCCVMLLVAGVNPRVVSDQMGHSDVAFTLRVYADALSSMHGGAAEAMDDALG